MSLILSINEVKSCDVVRQCWHGKEQYIVQQIPNKYEYNEINWTYYLYEKNIEFEVHWGLIV